jgi:hypothetical protein
MAVKGFMKHAAEMGFKHSENMLLSSI